MGAYNAGKSTLLNYLLGTDLPTGINPVTAVATGGLARVIAPFCRKKIILDEDLLLKGLWVIYKKNR